MKINAAISGFSDDPVSIFSMIAQLKNGVEVLLIAKKGSLTEKKDEETALIVDLPLRSNYDMLFTADRFLEALEAYQSLKSTNRIKIDDSMTRYAPDRNIEFEGISSHGKLEYRLESVSNGQIAILATCLYFIHRNGYRQATEFADRMQRFFTSI